MRIASSSRGYLPPFLVCLCFIQRCYGASHHHPPPAKVPSRNGTRLANGQTEVHHRPKRGWIWNQFFVLEEHIGPESQYVGKVRKTILWYFVCIGDSVPVDAVVKIKHMRGTRFNWVLCRSTSR
jgi:cadherin 18 type 2